MMETKCQSNTALPPQVSVFLVWSCQLAKLIECGNCCLCWLQSFLSLILLSAANKERMVAVLLLEKPLSCGGNAQIQVRAAEVWRGTSPSLPVICAKQGLLPFPSVTVAKIVGLNTKGGFAFNFTWHRTCLLWAGWQWQEWSASPSYCLISHLLGLPGDIRAEFSNPVVPSLLRRKRSCSWSSNYADRAGEGSRLQAVDITVLKSCP